MAKKWYGSVHNRIEENKNYNKDNQIHVGDDVTKYYWSDRKCYYVTKVINQEHIFISEYYVCADRELQGGMGHQNWVYFKTSKEYNEYLAKYGLSLVKEREKEPQYELMLKNGVWKEANRYNWDWISKKEKWQQNMILSYLTPKQQEKVKSGKEVVKYSDFGNISFGVKDYYYDWEF